MELTYPPHFTREEMILSDYAVRHDINNEPTPEIEINLKRVANWLEILREHIGAPIIVTSGYRCPYLNNAIGGSPHSAHIAGLAADIHTPAMTIKELAHETASFMYERGYDQIIWEFDRWVHVGLREGVNRMETLTARRENGKTVYHRGFL